MLELPRVRRIAFDVCMAWVKATGDDGVEGPARKRTGIATNSEAVAEALGSLQCDRRHAHVPLLGGKATGCQAYPEDFCHIVCAAYARQVALDRARDGIALVETCGDGGEVDVTDVFAPLVAGELSQDAADCSSKSQFVG